MIASSPARLSDERPRTGHSAPRLRVALLAGTLGQGGAEKQLIYTARALRQSNVAVQLYSLRRDEFYKAALQELNLRPIWIGRHESPLLRLGAFVRALWAYRPHVIQSGHFFGKDRKSTRLNSSHGYISYAVFCLKKKKQHTQHHM